jgi:hypothetical protein
MKRKGWLTRLRPLSRMPPSYAGSFVPYCGDHGPSASALAAASGWRLRRPAAARHAAHCACRDLCSGSPLGAMPPQQFSKEHINVWSYGFMQDQTARGKRFKFLTVLDEFPRAGLVIPCAHHIMSGG